MFREESDDEDDEEMNRELLRVCSTIGDNLRTVRELVHLGANVNCDGHDGDNFNDTPVTNSVMAGNVKILEYLLEEGADPNYSPSHEVSASPKFLAMGHNHPECLAMILATGVEVNDVKLV